MSPHNIRVNYLYKYAKFPVMNSPLTIQSGRPSSEIIISTEAQQDVHIAYLVSMRQRFKTEINRLSQGDMRNMLNKQLKNKDDAEKLSFLMTYVYAFNWLQQNLHADFREEVLNAFSRGPQAFLMQMLLKSRNTVEFIQAYIDYWLHYQGDIQLQQQQIFELFQQKSTAEALTEYIADCWEGLNLFGSSFAVGYKYLAKQEKQRYNEMLDDKDKERLALIDTLPDTMRPGSFTKLGIIPAMGCPQTCRHCMFIFRPLMHNTDDPAKLFAMIDELTTSILFTGGDLTKHLDHFFSAISSMRKITTFAILLNGDFADNHKVTRDIMGKISSVIRQRPAGWPKAKVILQISFDEFHQEVIVNKKGELKERIPVTKIANIVEVAPEFTDEIQLCLLHKQGHLNFSMDLFKKGVFARLTKELGRRGHQLEILSTAAASRLKRNPQNPQQPAQLIKDATFILTKHPETHILLTSSTIDAYGRAVLMELHESVNERDLLKQMLAGKGAGSETFDKDLMFWFNGWATLFSAVHMCLGNVFEDGLEIIRKRQLKDPLSSAMHNFDLRLLDYYRELSDDLDLIIEASTGPHHLYHTITEESSMRLHMTRRLIESSASSVQT